MKRAAPAHEYTNRILQFLRPSILKEMKPELMRVELKRGDAITKVGSPVRHQYFIENGLISVIKAMENGQIVEVGAVGIEGMAAPFAVFEMEEAALDTVVQIPGYAYRCRSGFFRDLVMRHPDLDAFVQRYQRFMIGQLTQTSACNGLHSLDCRCCRWLLIAHDSSSANEISLTHEFLAMMLGVQRPSLSLVLGSLKRDNIISTAHGRITVRNRQSLEARSCECYRDTQEELARVFACHLHGRQD